MIGKAKCATTPLADTHVSAEMDFMETTLIVKVIGGSNLVDETVIPSIPVKQMRYALSWVVRRKSLPLHNYMRSLTFNPHFGIIYNIINIR